MSSPRPLRPAEDGLSRQRVFRVIGHGLVLCIMVSSAVVAGRALSREKDIPAAAPVVPLWGEEIEAEPTPQPEPSVPATGPGIPIKAEPFTSVRHARSGFLHPGVVVSLDHLDIARGHIINGGQPRPEAFDQIRRSGYSDLAWQPRAREVVDCGYYSNPDNGCTDEWHDAVAAYTHALMWYFTRDLAHARKATEIIDAWSGTLRRHTNVNGPLQAGWSAASLVKAAEIMRYTYPGWDRSLIERAEEMFRHVYLPKIRGGAPRGSEGNWDLIMFGAAIGIAVFIDDRKLFDQMIERWRARVRAYIYVSADGARPVGPPKGLISGTTLTRYWHGQTQYVDGLVQETCRDLSHTGWGLEALAQTAETAWIQGIDLYAEVQQRLVSALEFHANLALGDAVPDWLCAGSLRASFNPIPEIAYNHYHNRLRIEMPLTEKLIRKKRPQGASHFFGWATLTSARVH